MLFKIFKIDKSSKRSAFRVSIFNLLLTFFLTLMLAAFVFLIFECYDEETAEHVSGLIWVEVGLNVSFFPFAIVLAVGIKKDKYKWVRIWIKAKVVQASYIFLLNFVMQVYITWSLNVGDGLVVLVYTLIVEVFYMENIIYMHNYQRNRESENTEVPKNVPDSVVIQL